MPNTLLTTAALDGILEQIVRRIRKPRVSVVCCDPLESLYSIRYQSRIGDPLISSPMPLAECLASIGSFIQRIEAV